MESKVKSGEVFLNQDEFPAPVCGVRPALAKTNGKIEVGANSLSLL